MAKLTIPPVPSGYASVEALNERFSLIETAVENTVSRDGSGPNHLLADVDFNSYSLLNVNQIAAKDIKINGRSIEEDINAQLDETLAIIAESVEVDIALAKAWANEAEDVVVADGEFSSKHYSAKSSGSADGASLSETNAAGSAAGALASEEQAYIYQQLGLGTDGTGYDLGFITDPIIIFPTNLGSVA